MRRRSKRRMSQLLKGLFIGIVLLLAIIGTTKLLDKNTNKYVDTAQNSENVEIPAPSINIVSEGKAPDTPETENSKNTDTPSDADTAASTPNKDQATETNDDYNRPTLEGEQTPEEIAAKIKAEQEKNIAYGFLKATAINPKSKQQLKANFTIFNDKNIKVIEGDSTNNPSFKLPVGRYRVVATLLNSKNQETKAESTENILIREEEITNKVFKVSPPVSIGILQVSSINAKNRQAMRANFTIRKENGEIVATRNNVANTLFKLEAGSYKVSVKRGENTDSRTIDINAGESSKEVFKLQEASLQGKLLVRAFEAASDKKVEIDILITNASDEVMQKLTAVNQTEISLPIGNYTINVTTPYAQANKNVSVTSGKTLNEIFRFDPPAKEEQEKPKDIVKVEEATTEPDSEQEPDSVTTKKEETEVVVETEIETKIDKISDKKEEIVISDDVKITAVEKPNTNETTENNDTEISPDQPQESILTKVPEPIVIKEINKEFNEDPKPALGRLSLHAKNDSDSAPIKSNFYIQTLSGKHIAKKIYADNATFKLKPGTYKVTVRANKRENIVKTLQVTAKQQNNATFSLKKSYSNSVTKTTQSNTQPRNNAPTKVNRPNNAIGNGFLKVSMRPSGNIKSNDSRLNSHFIVIKKSGEKIVELTSVPRANFKLDVGEYKITAINNRNPRSQSIRVRDGQVTHISFNIADFNSPPRATPRQQTQRATPRKQVAAPFKGKGGLRSHIINQAGQHLKGNLSIVDNAGRVVARANNVSVGIFNLPPATYTVKLDYRGLRGSKKVDIITGETTVQNFTIAQ